MSPITYFSVPDSEIESRDDSEPSTLPDAPMSNSSNVDRTPTEPVVNVEYSIISSSANEYWIKIVDLKPIQAWNLDITSLEEATRAMKRHYVGNIIYITSARPLEPIDRVHAAWTALITWHKTGTKPALWIGSNPLEVHSIAPKGIPNIFHVQRWIDCLSQAIRLSAFPITHPLTPAIRPSTTLVRSTERRYWIAIGVNQQTTHTIWHKYHGEIVYIQSEYDMQWSELDCTVLAALLIWCRSGEKCGLAIGKTLFPATKIEPRDLYGPPFKVDGLNVKIIPFTDIYFVQQITDTVDVVRLADSEHVVHKKMAFETNPEEMILEVQKLISLAECKYAPKIIAVTGDRTTGECRGILIQWVGEIPSTTLNLIPLTYNGMRIEVTTNLVKALVAFEEKGVYLQDLKPEHVVLTRDDGLYIIDFGGGVTDGYYPEDELEKILEGDVTFRVAKYGLAMTLRVLWKDCGISPEGSPFPPRRLRRLCPPNLLALLDDPDRFKCSGFRELQDKIFSQ